MNQTEKLYCPHCKNVQVDEIHDLVEGGDMDGTFSHDCEECGKTFTVEYEYKPYIKTY